MGDVPNLRLVIVYINIYKHRIKQYIQISLLLIMSSMIDPCLKHVQTQLHQYFVVVVVKLQHHAVTHNTHHERQM